MIVHGAAAAGFVDRRDADAQAIQHARGGGIGVGRQPRLHAAFEHQHAAAVLLGRARHGRTNLARQLGLERGRQQRAQGQTGLGQRLEQRRTWHHGAQALTQQAFVQWPRYRLLDHFAADVQQVVVLHPGRAGGLAVAAGQAAVQVLLGGARGRLPFQHLLDQVDAAARAVELVAEDLVGRAGRGAEAAMDAGEPVTLDRVGLFADGVAVKRIGLETFKLAHLYCDDVITVSSDEICAAIKDIFDDLRAVAEPAGALALAGLKKYAASANQTQNLSAVLSGANLNFDTLRYVSERCELGEKKEAVFAVTIPEEKGSFRRFCQTLGGRAITEFNYRYASDNKAHIFVGIKLRHGAEELQQVNQALSAAGYDYQDLSDDELAKLHVRHMVGGMPPRLVKEQVYQFNFPEYPGALMNFLNTLGEKWNITLFHYRNHGAATGDVLAGFEIADHAEIAEHLDTLGYEYRLVTSNGAYKVFLTAD